MLVEVTLIVEILGTLGSRLRPSFVQFQQGQNCAKRCRIHQLMVENRVMSPYEFTSKTHSLSTEDLGKFFID